MFAWNNDAHNYSNDKIEHMSINTLTSSQSREGPVSGLYSGPISSSASICLSSCSLVMNLLPELPSPTPAENPLVERSVEDIMN